jgi:hypothetical protein
VTYCADLRTFKIQSIAQRVCLVIDWEQMLPNDVIDARVAIETLIGANDTEGEAVCVIGMMDRNFRDSRSEDFFSRWKRRVIWNTPPCVTASDTLYSSALLQCHLLAIPYSSSPVTGDIQLIAVDLRGSQRWKSFLLGGVHIDGGCVMPVVDDRTLLSQLERKHSQPVHVCIRNTPCFSHAFSMWWEALLRNKFINHFGRLYQLPPLFSWSFQVTTISVTELKPLRFMGKEIVWFVQNDTIQFINAFPCIDCNGVYQQHQGFLQEMKSSGRIVLDSLSLTKHEIADLVGANGASGLLSGRIGCRQGTHYSSCTIRCEIVGPHLPQRHRCAIFAELSGDCISPSARWLEVEGDSMAEATVGRARRVYCHSSYTRPAAIAQLDHIPTNLVPAQCCPHCPHPAALHRMHTPLSSIAQDATSIDSTSASAANDIEEILREKRPVLLSGPPSSGKSFLAKAFHRYEDPSTGSSSAIYNLGEQTARSLDISPLSDSSAVVKRQPSNQLLRLIVNSQMNQLDVFLEAQCYAVLVVDEYNLQNEGTCDDLLAVSPSCPGYDGTFFYKGQLHQLSSHCKTVLLIGNPATQTGRVASVIDSHCFRVQCDAPSLTQLICRAVPRNVPDFQQLRERLTCV